MSRTWLETQAQTLVQANIETGLGTVLCLGRGASALIEALPDGAARRVILLEPDPRQAQQKAKRFGDTVTVLPLAFSDTDGTAPLRDFTLAACGAVRPASGLEQLFPGIRSTGTQQVDTCSAASLLADVPLEPDGIHLLLLGAPGEEHSALTQMAALEALTRFRYVLTPLPVLPLYEGASTGATLQIVLEANGFSLQHQDISDPDCPLALFQYDTARAALLTRIAALEQALSDTEAQAEERARNITAQRDSALRDASDHAARQDSALQAAQDHTAQQANAVQALEKQISTLTEDRDSLQRRADSLQHKLTETETLYTSAETAVETLRDELSTSLQTHKLLQANLKDLQDQHAALRQEKDALENLVQTAAQTLERMQAETGKPAK